MKLGQLSDLITLVGIASKDLLNQLETFSNYHTLYSKQYQTSLTCLLREGRCLKTAPMCAGLLGGCDHTHYGDQHQ